MSGHRPFVARAGLVLAGTALAVALIEAGARLRWLDGGPPSPPNETFLEADARRGWRLSPGKRGLSQGPGYDVPMRVNAKGLRDVEHDYEKKPGVFRIMVLGDSFMEAYQVPLDDSFCRNLERSLASKAASGAKVEVINMGVRAYGTGQEYLSYVHEGVKYHPDLVLLAFYPGNDLADDSKELNMELFGSSESIKVSARPFFVPAANGGVQPAPFDASLAEQCMLRKQQEKMRRLKRERRFWDRSLVYRIIATRLRRLPASGETPQPLPALYGLYYEEYPPVWTTAWRVTQGLILKTKAAAEASGARFALVAVPAAIEADARYREEVMRARPELRKAGIDMKKPYRILEDFARRNAMSHVSLLPGFTRHIESTGGRLHHAVDPHWNESGHRLAAEIVSDYLVSNRLFGRAPRGGSIGHP